MGRNGRKATRVKDGDTIMIIDANTGEVIDEPGHFIPEGQSKSQREYLRNKTSALKGMDFIWCYYEKWMPLYNSLPPSYVAKLIYAATFCGYEGNVLVGYRDKPLTKKTLMEVMCIGRTVFYRWLGDMSDMGYIDCSSESISISKSLVSKGVKRKDQSAMRVFTAPTQHMYKTTVDAGKNMMGYYFMFMPYLNLSTNTLLNDINDLITLDDISEMLGVSRMYGKEVVKNLLILNETYGKDIIHVEETVNARSKRIKVALSTDVIFGGSDKEMELCDFKFERYI